MLRESSGGIRSPCLHLFLFLVATVSFRGIAGDVSSSPKNGTKSKNHSAQSSSGSVVVGVLLIVVAITVVVYFLYKLWQRKKREEQYACLIKLFEEDDELEVELGLRN
ncbi:hypothetical protein SAY86_005608 [Trapa natans]|uniref:Uncharacterized protein n=1 Tax=Trapa natans TaxID=22666 RepID=A0AAN7L889_TRANT|nr:hypothetical protein SAY86_005608 [Trapa natans]